MKKIFLYISALLAGAACTAQETLLSPDGRLRLEVNEVNQGAVHLYEKAGYTYLRYEQMIIDKVK